MRCAVPGFAEGAVTVPAMRHDKLLFVLVPLYLMVVGALVIHKIWFREEAKPVAMEDKAPVAKEDKADGPQAEVQRQAGLNANL